MAPLAQFESPNPDMLHGLNLGMLQLDLKRFLKSSLRRSSDGSSECKMGFFLLI